MADFNNLLKDLHASVGTTITSPIGIEQDEYIVINKDRTFTLPKEFNPIIAYEGDVNSQIVTFSCPRYNEGHDLSLCQEKRLRWINSSGKNEGSSKLLMEMVNEDNMLLHWEAPPEAFVKAGQLSISISIFDIIDSTLVFSWNTPALSKLQVGESLNSVAYRIDNEENSYIPSKSEILLVNTETRTITAPSGYNSTFCNYGDVDTSTVYFQIKRYIRGIDILDESTILNVYWRIENTQSVESSLTGANQQKRLYAIDLDSRDSEGLVHIIWKPSKTLTENSMKLYGKVVIQLEFIDANGKVWKTSSFDGLSIGKNDFATNVVPLPEDQGETNAYVINGTIPFTDKKVKDVAGIVKLRSFTKNQGLWVRKNELVIETDSYGNYVSARIGQTEGEDARNSPIVAYAPNTTILIYGGDASGTNGG